MSPKKLYRIAQAAEVCGVNRSTLVTAVRAGHCKSYETACGLPLVTIEQVVAWRDEDRKPQGRPVSKTSKT